ncbi:mannose 1 phosphate guanyltransferase [Echinococcus multilocularis]|uniref:Mannose 1 phosphate guanyltransferase n=1 Tax=Echinococcus multilocularis TaxID=6211 RepID=A0A068YIL5_ECHMU|nr:mannose 1 phosphate guanyltransferase [Echinococcus multilocularis]
MLEKKTIKAVILIGGPAKGTRFRPLSLEMPKPLFPIAGYPMIYHHIEAFSKIPNMKEIILIGFYQPNEILSRLISDAGREFGMNIRYLQEFTSLGTAGGIFQFRDQISAGGLDLLFVMNADVCCDAPLQEMVDFHTSLGSVDKFVVLSTEATREQSMEFGCLVENPETNEITHYVEKPDTFVSVRINCGIYLFTPSIFKFIRVAFLEHQNQKFTKPGGTCKESIQLETEIFQPLAGSGTLYAFHTERFWSQIKHPGAVIYANRQMLALYHRTHPHRLAVHRVSINSNGNTTFDTTDATTEASGDGETTTTSSARIIGDVYLHPTARVHPTAVLGPNVSVGAGAVIGAGVRLRDSIVLRNAEIHAHACCLNCVVGWNAVIGQWARVEGTAAFGPNPNTPFTKLEVVPVFNAKGQLNPSITVIGSNVDVPPEVIVLNSIVLPHKELSRSLRYCHFRLYKVHATDLIYPFKQSFFVLFSNGFLMCER